jgi:hypothetical protein
VRVLRVSIELIPKGNPAKKKTIAVLEIENVTNLTDISDYKVAAFGESPRVRRKATVRGHERRRWGPWKLVDRAIRALNLDLESE